MKLFKEHKFKLLSFVMVCISVFTLFLGITKTYAYETDRFSYTLSNPTLTSSIYNPTITINQDNTILLECYATSTNNPFKINFICNNNLYTDEYGFILINFDIQTSDDGITYTRYSVSNNLNNNTYNSRNVSFYTNNESINYKVTQQVNTSVSNFNTNLNFFTNVWQVQPSSASPGHTLINDITIYPSLSVFTTTYPKYIKFMIYNIDYIKSTDVGLSQYYDTYYGVIEDNYNQLLEDYDTLESNYNEIESNYNDLENNYLDLQSDYNELDDMYSDLRDSYTWLQRDYSDLQEQYDTLQTTYSNLINSYNELSYNYSQLQHDYHQLQTAYERLQGNYNALSNAFVDLDLQYDDLENSFNILQTQYNNMTIAMQSLNNSIDDSLLSVLVGNNYFTKSNINFENTNLSSATFPINSSDLYNYSYPVYVDNSALIDNVFYTNVALSKLLDTQAFVFGDNGVPNIYTDKFSYIHISPSILMPYPLRHVVGSGSETLHLLDYDYYTWVEPNHIMAKFVNLSIVSSTDLIISVNLINQDGSITYLPISRDIETQNYEISFADDDSRLVRDIYIECKYMNNSWVTAEKVISNINYVNDNNYTIGYNNGRDNGIASMQEKVNDLSSQLVESNALNTDLQIRINALTEQVNSFSADYGINNMLWTIASTPFESFKQIWNVELFGVNIASAITGFLTSIIVLYIIKRFFL